MLCVSHASMAHRPASPTHLGARRRLGDVYRVFTKSALQCSGTVYAAAISAQMVVLTAAFTIVPLWAAWFSVNVAAFGLHGNDPEILLESEPVVVF